MVIVVPAKERVAEAHRRPCPVTPAQAGVYRAAVRTLSQTGKVLQLPGNSGVAANWVPASAGTTR